MTKAMICPLCGCDVVEWFAGPGKVNSPTLHPQEYFVERHIYLEHITGSHCWCGYEVSSGIYPESFRQHLADSGGAFYHRAMCKVANL